MQQYGGLCAQLIYFLFAEHLEDIKADKTNCLIGKHCQEPGQTLKHLEKVGARDKVTFRIREADLIKIIGVLLACLNIFYTSLKRIVSIKQNQGDKSKSASGFLLSWPLKK